ncbi:MAG: urea ABC transporter substrate-binding protein [Cyanobacteriota bacterium]|nr:urea ABC transporter substrate-binding protein [Cyanobacteriota bacterium]
MVRVGILHSQSGTMAASERPLIDSALMAIAQINQAGGVLGESIEPILEDGTSDPILFFEKARKLIEEEGVTTVFGCWTSAARKAVKPIFEGLNALLWYPLQYEGLEQSPNIFYTGSCPNQQVEPAIDWLLDNDKKQFFLLGSDYVFPRTVNKPVRAQLKRHGGLVVGEEYIELGATNFDRTIENILKARPDVVFSTLNGDSNHAFYTQYHQAGIRAEDIPIVAVSVAEAELQNLGAVAVGHYSSWSYFQSLDLPENRQFVRDFQARYGADRVTSDPIEAAYTQVFLWKQAVETADSFEVDLVREAAYGQRFQAPGGPVTIEPNHHVWKHCYIGRVRSDGQFEIVHRSDGDIKPLPWLGIEELEFMSSDVAIELMGEVSQGIQQTWLLERKSRELEETVQKLKATQAELIQAAKMATLGQLVAGIAHEVKTPLSAIQSSVKSISEQLDETLAQLPQLFCHLSAESQGIFWETIERSSEKRIPRSTRERRKLKRALITSLESHQIEAAAEVADLLTDIGIYDRVEFCLPLLEHPRSTEILDSIYNISTLYQSTNLIDVATNRATKLLSALKTYSRSDASSNPVRAQVTEGVETVLMLYQSHIKQGVEVTRNYEAGLPPILCYPDELDQVWTNLIHNALQAMDNRGSLTIDVGRNDTHLIVSITDSGEGIPPDVMPKIFNSFFTTKPAGKGTGLGLDIVRHIIDRHCGSIDVESVPGKTTFAVSLPLAGFGDEK